MDASLEQIASKVKAVERRTPAYAEVIQWAGDLLSETVRASGRFGAVPLNLDQGISPEAWSQGRPFLDPAELSLDWKEAKALYRRLVSLLETRGGARGHINGLLKALGEDQGVAPRLMKAVLSSDLKAVRGAAQELGLDAPVLTILLRLSMRPALLNLAQSVLARLDLSQWNYGHCPVCGSAPVLADLSGEGGKRTLHCCLCEAAWPYPRLRCPFCENDNHEELSYLRAETEAGLRVDLCSRCGHYLKTIDLRELSGPVIVPLDDVATWHLDLIAQKSLDNEKSPSAPTA